MWHVATKGIIPLIYLFFEVVLQAHQEARSYVTTIFLSQTAP